MAEQKTALLSPIQSLIDIHLQPNFEGTTFSEEWKNDYEKIKPPFAIFKWISMQRQRYGGNTTELGRDETGNMVLSFKGIWNYEHERGTNFI